MFNPCVIFQWSLSFWSLGEKRTKKKRAISQKKPFLLTEWPSCSTCCHRNRHVLNYELFLQNPSCWDLPNCYFETVLLNDFSPEVIQFILILPSDLLFLWTPCQPYHGCCFVCCHLKPAIETHWKKKKKIKAWIVYTLIRRRRTFLLCLAHSCSFSLFWNQALDSMCFFRFCFSSDTWHTYYRRGTFTRVSCSCAVSCLHLNRFRLVLF